MPEIKIKHVVTFSSEDKAFPAENLVNSSGYKKWKTGKTGEKSAMVVLQLEVASQIHQIDIGNESSAFVEVLVGRTGMSVDDYQVILVASSFMNPLESRGNQNSNRVRIFSTDSLSQAVRDQKWDMVKVVCTQPFNKTTQYGLSFVKFYSKPEDGGEPSAKPAASTKTSLGAFVLKSDESGDDLAVGSLFKQKKEHKEAVPLTGAAAVRAAARLADEARPSTSRDVASSSPRSHKDRSQDPPATSKTPTNKRRHSPDPSRSREHHPDKVTTPDSSRPRPPSLHKQSTSLSSVASSTSTSSHRPKQEAPPLKRSKTEPPKKSKEREFRDLMEKVTFVLSGFQNPYRGDLRDKALAMGATYRPDWGRGCTHLICAFENTPKYNQVKGKGRIVKKQWVTDCYKKQKLLPWREYRLGRARSPPGSSDESDGEGYSPVKKKSPHKQESERKKATPNKSVASNVQSDSGESTEALTDMDTDEEIERVKQKQIKKTESESKSPQKKPKESVSPKNRTPERTKPPPVQSKIESKKDQSDGVYDVSTDEEEVQNGKDDKSDDKSNSVGDSLEDLMDMFTDKVFFLYGQFSANDRRALTRYISAYDGETEEYMTDTINYVITNSNWDSNFDSALADNPGISFVRPAWIYDCHEKQKLIPHQKYVVVPE